MRPFLLVFVAVGVTGLPAPRAWADCNDPFGKPGEVLDFHLKLKRADWMALLASRVPSTDGNRAACNAEYPELQAEFRCGTEMPWLKVGVRKKRGEERGVEAPLKPPMKIDINEDFMGKVPEAMGQRWPAAFGNRGYRKLTLNNGQGNKAPGRVLMLPNLLSEHVAMRLIRREVPEAPGVAFANVTIHLEDKPEGEFHGVYILLEDVDRSAIRRRWNVDLGRLVKLSKAGCPSEIQYDDGPPNASKAAFDAWIGKGPASIEEAKKALDVEAALRQEAIREILVNGDDTLFFAGGDGNNHYYFDPREGLRHYMPWDVDLTFGQQQQNCAPNSLKCPATFPILTWCGRNVSRLGRALACNPQIQKQYLTIMCQLTNGSLSAGEILKVWDEADSVARPGVGREKDLIWRGMDPLSTTADKSYGAEYVRLKEWIPARIRSVQDQITKKGVTCMPGCQEGAKEACTYLGCAGERRCEGNLWTTCRPAEGCGAFRPSPPVDGGAARADAGVPDASDPTGNADASGPSPVGPAPQDAQASGVDTRKPASGPARVDADVEGDPDDVRASTGGFHCTVGRPSNTGSSAAWMAGAALAWALRRRRRRPGDLSARNRDANPAFSLKRN